jgi:hypothetical protein
MKKLGINMLIALTLCVGLIGTALANGKNMRKTLTLDQDVMVNDKLVKKGTYQFKFDAASNSVAILDENRGLVATVKVNVKEGLKKAPHNSLEFKTAEKGRILTAIKFGGDNRTLHIGDLQNASAGE